MTPRIPAPLRAVERIVDPCPHAISRAPSALARQPTVAFISRVSSRPDRRGQGPRCRRRYYAYAGEAHAMSTRTGMLGGRPVILKSQIVISRGQPRLRVGRYDPHARAGARATPRAGCHFLRRISEVRCPAPARACPRTGRRWLYALDPRWAPRATSTGSSKRSTAPTPRSAR
jgi:hypothetical protein